MTLLRRAVAGLSPNYFAMVMATGIVSIAAKMTGMPRVASALFGLNIVFYIILWTLYLARLGLEPGRFLTDLGDHARGVGFFTAVAGTCVLGNQFVLIGGDSRTGTAFWLFGIVLWLLLTYVVFTLLITKPEKPTLAQGLNGAWLLTVVATQAVSALGCLVAPSLPGQAELALFFSLTAWLAGGMLYIWIIAMIFYRYMFVTLAPSDLTPPYWINMGAMAISTLAGTLLIAQAPAAPVLGEILPFLKGFTLLFWATATLWIPMLLILGVWRHVVMRFPLKYDPAYWGAVFPLGMYTACTWRLADVLNLPFLRPVPRGFILIALAAWLATALGLAWTLTRAALASFREAPAPAA
jgi:tellurite resistance protein TehA-like permease